MPIARCARSDGSRPRGAGTELLMSPEDPEARWASSLLRTESFSRKLTTLRLRFTPRPQPPRTAEKLSGPKERSAAFSRPWCAESSIEFGWGGWRSFLPPPTDVEPTRRDECLSALAVHSWRG